MHKLTLLLFAYRVALEIAERAVALVKFPVIFQVNIP